MKLVVGLFMGSIAGLLFYMGSAMIIANAEPSSGFVLISFVGGWAISTYIMVNGTSKVSQVIARGFLVGAAEWLMFIVVGIVYSGKFFSEVTPPGSTDAEIAGSAIGAGLFSMLTGAFSLFMAVFCLIGFAIVYFVGKDGAQPKPSQLKPCPFCVELILKQAKKCKYCGSDLT